ncbi:MAG: NAD(+) synthase [Treponemataceae bacterium]|nr:NAD(+) synthase [Treponemataceae bacterium]
MQDFFRFGFLRTACASPELVVADCRFNAEEIIRNVREASAKNVQILCFPELCVTGYTCSDLFLQKNLQNSAISALEHILFETKDCNVLFAVGLPLAIRQFLFNTACFAYKGKLLAIVPKVNIPNYQEFYEARHFTPFSKKLGMPETVDLVFQKDVPFGTDILIEDNFSADLCIAAEICEDLWVPEPPSVSHALAGANVIFNLSCSNQVVGKKAYREMLVKSQSGRLCAAYLYANGGTGESSTDLIFDGDSLISENGSILAKSEPYSNGMIVADIDIERLCQERRKITTFTGDESAASYRRVRIPLLEDNDSLAMNLERRIESSPFVPQSAGEQESRCKEIIEMQARGLAKRLRHTHAKSAVLGLSGGLDSTLALLVVAEAFDICGISRSQITAVTMPGFGTTDRTYTNALCLAKEIGASLQEISIVKAVEQHFADIGHDKAVHDVTYENCQARERTQILMDLANKTGGLVIGTGDLSELALGWATYNGDHMSMYGVNASIPKTLVRYLVFWYAKNAEKKSRQKLAEVLYDILETPVSPELLPPVDGKIAQKTEELVGPYELHDFFLYYMMRFGFSPDKILYLAETAFAGIYDRAFILKWLNNFFRRFFAQQFKRSCLPDGAKVGTVCLSPRGDWRMPSDASSSDWLAVLPKD